MVVENQKNSNLRVILLAMKPLKILLVDDHKMIRDGLKSYLEDDDRFEIVSEAANGKDALSQLQNIDADIVLTDIMMPEMDGISLCKEITQTFPGKKVIALTMMGERQYIKQMLNNGASGYILKDCSEDEIKAAIMSVSEGRPHYSQEVTEIIMDDLRGVKKPKSNVVMEMPLSDREKEVLHLIIKEHSNQEIADKLFISPRTVDAHKRNLLEKTGAKNVAGLVLYAIERKLFDDI